MSSSSPSSHSSNVDEVVSRMERLQQARGVARGSVRDRLYRKFVEAVREEEGLGGGQAGAEAPVVETVEQGTLPQMRAVEGCDGAASPSAGNPVSAQVKEGPTEWGAVFHRQPEQWSPKMNNVVVTKDEDGASLGDGKGAGWDHRTEVGGSRGVTGATDMEDTVSSNLSDRRPNTTWAYTFPVRTTSLLIGNHAEETQHTRQMLQISHSNIASSARHGIVPPPAPSLKLESEPSSMTPVVSLSTANAPSKWSSVCSHKLDSFDTLEPQGQIVRAPEIPNSVVTTGAALLVAQTHLTLNTQHQIQQPDSSGLDRVIITGVREEPGMTILSTEIVSQTGIPIPRSRSVSLQELRRRASLINAATPQIFMPQNTVTRIAPDSEHDGRVVDLPLKMTPQPQQNRPLRRSTRSQTKIMASMDIVTPAASPTSVRTQPISRQTRQVQFTAAPADASATPASKKTAATPTKAQGEPHLPGHSYTIQGRHHAYCRACAAQRKSVIQTSGQSKKRTAPARQPCSSTTGAFITNSLFHQFPYPDDVDWQSESMAFRCLQTRNPLLGTSSANLTRQMAGHMKSCGTGIRSRSDGGAWGVSSMHVANTGGLIPSVPARRRKRQEVSTYFEDWQYYRGDERIESILGVEEAGMNSLEVLADAATNEGGVMQGERTRMLFEKSSILQGHFCPIESWTGRVEFPESAIRGGCRPKEDAEHTEETLAERLQGLRRGWRVGQEDGRVLDDAVVTDDSDTILDPDLSLSTETNDDTIDANDISFSTDSSGDTIDMNDSSTSATACERVTRNSITPPLPFFIQRGALESPVTPGPIMRCDNGQTVRVRDSDDPFASEYETSSTVDCLGNGNPVGKAKGPLRLVSCNSLSTTKEGIQSTSIRCKRLPSPAAIGEGVAQCRLKKMKVQIGEEERTKEENWGTTEEQCSESGEHNDDDGNMEVQMVSTNKFLNPNPLFTDELLAQLLAMPRRSH